MSALPAIAVPDPDDEFSLSALVRAELDGDEPDPHRIAESVIASLSLPDARAALKVTLPDYVRKTIARSRACRPVAVGGGPSLRWVEAARLENSGELAILRWRVNVGAGDWKFLGDCTRDDVRALAEAREAEAAANAAVAEKFRRLLAAMKRKKVVSDVRPDLLKEIFDAVPS